MKEKENCMRIQVAFTAKLFISFLHDFWSFFTCNNILIPGRGGV